MRVQTSIEVDLYAVVWMNGDEIKVRVYDDEGDANDYADELREREIGAPNGLRVVELYMREDL